MKKIVIAVSVVLFTCTLTACSSNYVMHTQDGRTIVTMGKPIKDRETGTIGYTDVDGNQQQINVSEVKEMSKGN